MDYSLMNNAGIHAGVSAGIGALAGWFLPILYGAIGAIPSLLTLYTDLERNHDQLRSSFQDNRNVFDFIVGE